MAEAAGTGAGPVRAGEELDAVALGAWLRGKLPGSESERALAVEQFAGGYSNLTYLLRLGDRDLVLRRPPPGAAVKGGHDMGREYRILKGLEGVYAKAPRALLYCDDAGVIGAPFYVMERAQGIILRNRLPPDLALDPETVRRIGLAVVDTLVELHAVDVRATGLVELGRPDGYVERQVRGWRERYAKARTHDLEDMDAVGDWLAAHLPASSEAVLIHNDFKLDNLVLDPQDPTQVVAVLDWEMATIGDPLMDLGVTLAYWIEEEDPPVLQRIGLGRLPGSLRRAEVVARYAEGRGLPAGDLAERRVFYYVFGLYKVAVIAQQIYARYRQGFTRDERFGGLDAVVAACAGMAAQATFR